MGGGEITERTEIIWRPSNRLIFIEGIQQVPAHFNKENFMKVKRDIAGQDEMIEDIYDKLIVPRTIHPSHVSKFDIAIPVGAVLEGPKGNGKSALAESIARNLDCLYKVIKGPELKSCYVGKTEKNIRNLFEAPLEAYEEAGAYAPLYIILLDEMESLCPQRKQTESGNDNSITNTMLACIEGNRLPPNVIIFGTTNRIDLIDSAFLREGRLGLVYYLRNPDVRQRRDIISLYMDKIPESFTYTANKQVLDKHEMDRFKDRIAELTDGLTGSDIRAAISRAKMNFLRNNIVDAKITEMKLDVDTFYKELLARKKVVDSFTYYYWNDELKVFFIRVFFLFRCICSFYKYMFFLEFCRKYYQTVQM